MIWRNVWNFNSLIGKNIYKLKWLTFIVWLEKKLKCKWLNCNIAQKKVFFFLIYPRKNNKYKRKLPVKLLEKMAKTGNLVSENLL